MLDFMIISLPRSGSTWAANWLTTERALCVHDPLWTMPPDEIAQGVERLAPDRIRGIACTGLWRWPSWINAQPGRKLILRRDRGEVERSMQRLGLPRLPGLADRKLAAIKGTHIDWRALFDPEAARSIWDFLTDGREPFDQARHASLAAMRIEPKFEAVQRDLALNARLNNMDSCSRHS